MDSFKNYFDIYRKVVQELWDAPEYTVFRHPVDYQALGTFFSKQGSSWLPDCRQNSNGSYNNQEKDQES